MLTQILDADVAPLNLHGFLTIGTVNLKSNESGYIQFNANDPADGSEAYTFQGNFAWVRVYMDREHVGDGATYDTSYGSVSRVVLSA